MAAPVTRPASRKWSRVDGPPGTVPLVDERAPRPEARVVVPRDAEVREDAGRVPETRVPLILESEPCAFEPRRLEKRAEPERVEPERVEPEHAPPAAPPVVHAPRAVPAHGVEAPSDALVRWPSFGPPGYLGQLHAEFQSALARERAALARSDCRFYHSVDLPDGESVPGPWDLRGHEHEYLGNVDLAGRSVLEFGPATGALTYFMERSGAAVTAFEAGYDVSIDLHPAPGAVDTRKLRLDHARMINEVQNSWWYLHREFGSSARMVYGDIYALPGDLGEYDVSVFASILLHLRSPVAALEQAARRTRSTIVVTEPWAFGPDSMLDNVMKIFPFGESGRWTVWWSISAGAVVQMLDAMGFRDAHVEQHTQRHQFGHDADAPFTDINMYTVTAHRA